MQDQPVPPDRGEPAQTELQARELKAALKGRPVVLVGMMGSGKTSVGKRLAQRLGLDFADADQAIEEAAGQSISEIFAQHGEPYFRDGERRVIKRLLLEGNRVIATGGGAFMNAETRAAALQGGVTVWLRADFHVLWERVRRRPHRPLLQNADPEGTLRRLMADRYPVYALAHVTIQSRDVPQEMVVDDAVRGILGHLAGRNHGEA